ncbi:hypothetical protein SELR_03020 [Selenomonas ruminantium subsp. lactilytica TAM6421]|uniref:Uncharacterized protein n=1 Tax=Selenomonas ruminantium subsp. lactilytica (strain NBRC 103574 / TAM6421) TaxID=927704 RepID=I0GMM3_SELRL|nr:hypothetical protein [Selenomonas ruminantium]BAL82010.1 hypothetical protein SELR_03020 [Selenomonas ruminantium subsp. lactilytica TAM6421]
MKLKRILPLLCGLWLMAVSTSFAMENMEFVDASGPTGYYVDTNSITYAKRAELQPDGKKKDYELVQARVAVVKARTNRCYTYLMEFNKEKMVYRTLACKVQAYDTKKIVEENKDVSPELPFVETSPMQEVVDFIYEQPRQGN